MDVDIILEASLAPQQILELGQAAERVGIRTVWSSNYFACPDAFMSLVPLAQATGRLRLGPVAISPFEMHPLKIANAILTLNEFCDGRAIIAIGAGEGVTDAIAIEKPKRLVAAVREAIEFTRKAVSGELTNGYEGDFFRIVHPYRADWASAPAPLIYAAAMGPQMLRMGGRIADGLQMGDMPTQKIDAAIQNVRTGLAKRTRPADAFRIGNFFGWHIKKDRETAFREARREIAWRGRQLSDEFISPFLNEDECRTVREKFGAFAQAWFDRSGEIEGVPEHIVNGLIEGMTSTGDLGDLDREIERYRQFERAGLTEIALKLHDNPMDALKIIGEQVVPALR
jgi:alkanesulfonate monooxygenase SsuD/methylene tetrahydromethanopterin reductase-like flavin-dependent oxidoreductase (luciferase family)